MPQGDKSSYTNKQKRQAIHIEAGYEKKGLSPETAKARAWATVNKLSGGGKKSGSGRHHELPFALMHALTSKEISLQLKTVPSWSKRAKIISRTYTFGGFLDAIRFVGLIAKKAEKANHHPDIDIRWNKVTLALTTHDADGLSVKDFTLARKGDEAFAKVLE